jgi:hypothetical protein
MKTILSNRSFLIDFFFALNIERIFFKAYFRSRMK